MQFMKGRLWQHSSEPPAEKNGPKGLESLVVSEKTFKVRASCPSLRDDGNWDYNISEPDPEISQLRLIFLVVID